jgi:hypothetical protein
MVAVTRRKAVWPQVGKFRLDSRRRLDAVLFSARAKAVIEDGWRDSIVGFRACNGAVKCAATKSHACAQALCRARPSWNASQNRCVVVQVHPGTFHCFPNNLKLGFPCLEARKGPLGSSPTSNWRSKTAGRAGSFTAHAHDSGPYSTVRDTRRSSNRPLRSRA